MPIFGVHLVLLWSGFEHEWLIVYQAINLHILLPHKGDQSIPVALVLEFRCEANDLIR